MGEIKISRHDNPVDLTSYFTVAVASEFWLLADYDQLERFRAAKSPSELLTVLAEISKKLEESWEKRTRG